VGIIPGWENINDDDSSIDTSSGRLAKALLEDDDISGGWGLD
jgi:hypothetical protein